MSTKPGAKSHSLKQVKIDKANAVTVAVSSAAVFILVFSFIASRTLLSQLSYQNRVAKAEQTALTQLRGDVTASGDLIGAFKAFVAPAQNIIGGSATGTQPQDGDNGKIVLDALPSQYDFPALTSSLQALLSRETVNITSIAGTDESQQQTTQTTQTTPGATIPQSGSSSGPIAMPFSFTVDGPYQNVQAVVNDFQNSIRPFQIQTLQLSGDQSDLTMDVTAQTYYQPAEQFSITTETIQ